MKGFSEYGPGKKGLAISSPNIFDIFLSGCGVVSVKDRGFPCLCSIEAGLASTHTHTYARMHLNL